MVTQSVGGGWEQLFWEVFRKTANPVALLSEDRTFVDLNEPTVVAFGRTRGELLARPVTEIIKPAEQALAERQWATFLRTGEFSGNRTFIRGDGEEVSFELAGRLTTINGARRAVFVIIAEPWHPETASVSDGEKHLTEREREVLVLMVEGLNNTQIAGRLTVSTSTIKSHVSNILSKLGTTSRTEAVTLALRSRLIR